MNASRAQVTSTISRRLYLLLAALLMGVAIWFAKDLLFGARTAIPLPDMTTANANVATATKQRFLEVQTHPTSAEAWGKYGEVLMVHEWTAEALQCFDAAAKLDPSEKRWLYLAGVLLDRQDPETAVEKYLAFKLLDPTYVPLFVRLGKTLQRLNRNQEAEASFRQAAKLNANEPQPLIGLARLAAGRNEWQQSVDWLEQAAKIAPTNREVLVELTRAKIVVGSAQTLTPATQVALMSGQKFEAMADPILQSLSEHETTSRQAALLAESRAAEGDTQQAASAFLELIKQWPELARPRINLASIYMTQGQVSEAEKTLREVVELFPQDPMGHLLLSYALETSGDWPESRRELLEAIRLKPDYADAHFALGMATERDGDLNAAIAAYRDAVLSNSRHIQARMALGLALKKQGNLAEAIQEMTAAVRLSPSDPVAQSYLAQAIAERDAAPKSDKP